MAADVMDLPQGFSLDVSSGGSTDLPSGFKLDVVAPIDRESGAGFWQRLQAGFKSNPESVANFYKAKMGDENVRLQNNEVQFLNPQTKTWTAVDPEGMDWGDVADFVGTLPEVVLGAFGGIAGGLVGSPTGPGAIATALGGAAAGTAAGNVIKQFIGSMLPGKTTETLGQRVGEVAMAGGMGAVGEGAGQLVFKGVVNPAVRALFSRGERAASQAELKAIERAVGVPEFRLKSGNETENLFALQQKVVQMVDDVRAGRAPQSDLAVGTELQNLFKTIDDNMIDILEKNADRDFKVLSHEWADIPIFQTPNLRSTIDKMIYQDTTTMGVPGAMAQGAEKLANELPSISSLRDIQLYLRRYGRIGYGKGDQTFLEKVGQSDREKAARELFAALSQDLEQTTKEVTAGGFPTVNASMAQDLRAAKNAYASGLKEMADWQDGIFKRVVGDYGPESAGRIVQNLNRLDANELKGVMRIIDTRPDVADAVRANWLETALQTSLDKAAARGSPGFNPRIFMDELGLTRRGGAERAQAMLGRSQASILSDLTTIQQAFGKMREMSDNGALLRNIPVSKHGLVMEFINSVGRNAKSISKWLNKPKSMEELRVLSQAKQPTQRAAAAFTYLLSDALADEARQ